MATIFSLSNSLALAAICAALLAPAACAEGDASCPPAQEGIRLKTVALFDGPPEELADLVPDRFHDAGGTAQSEWDVRYIFHAGRHLYVRCGYGPSRAAVVLKPAASTARCVFVSQPDGNVSLTCRQR